MANRIYELYPVGGRFSNKTVDYEGTKYMVAAVSSAQAHWERTPYGPSRPPRPTRRRSSYTTVTNPVAAAFADASRDASPAFADAAWQYRGFSEAERDDWVSAGLRPGQARDAAALRDAGLTAADLPVAVYGFTVLKRLQSGEGAASVARLLAKSRAQGQTG